LVKYTFKHIIDGIVAVIIDTVANLARCRSGGASTVAQAFVNRAVAVVVDTIANLNVTVGGCTLAPVGSIAVGINETRIASTRVVTGIGRCGRRANRGGILHVLRTVIEAIRAGSQKPANTSRTTLTPGEICLTCAATRTAVVYVVVTTDKGEFFGAGIAGSDEARTLCLCGTAINLDDVWGAHP
jgi:hypothetical protein